MMKALAPDFRELIKCLNDARAKYLLIGGYAVNFHGYHRNTADMDIWIAVIPRTPSVCRLRYKNLVSILPQ